MKKLTEKRLLKIGFEKNDGSLIGGKLLKDGEYTFIYTRYHGTSFESNSNFECKEKDTYYVTMFNRADTGKFYDYNVVKKLVKLINSGV